MRDALATDLISADEVSVSCATSRHARLPAALAGVHAIDADAAGQTDAMDFLTREAPAYDHVWVIAPESGDLLAALADRVGHERWVGCTVEAIRVAASKSATRRRLAASGIAVPPSWNPGEPEPEDGKGWIVKPDDGAGSVDTQRYSAFAAARDEFLARIDRGEASTLEAWVEGIPLSLSLLCSDGGAELLAINRQRIVSSAGATVVYQGVDVDVAPVDGPLGRQLTALVQRIAAAVPGLAGYVGVDLIWRAPALSVEPAASAGPVVIEINPRLTCAYVGLSAALGRNLAREILHARDPKAPIHATH